jgi:hypothetical protein
MEDEGEKWEGGGGGREVGRRRRRDPTSLWCSQPKTVFRKGPINGTEWHPQYFNY